MKKPYWKASHKAYYCNANGKSIRLSSDEGEAWAKWAELRSGRVPGVVVGLTLKQLADKYLSWVEANKAAATLNSYRRYLDRWLKHHANLGAAEVKPHHLTEIISLEFSACGDSSKWQFYKTAVAMFNWAMDQGHIDVNGLAKVKGRPQCGKRLTFLSPESYQKLQDACEDPRLADVLTILWETGCRPHEAFRATASHLDHKSRCLRYTAKEAKGKRARIIYLPEAVYVRLAELSKQYPEGPLLRNNIGEKWSSNLLSARLRVLKGRTDIKTCAYEFRHGFATRAIKAGVDLKTLSELMGHTDLTMLTTIYAHVHGDDDHMRGAMEKLAG